MLTARLPLLWDVALYPCFQGAFAEYERNVAGMWRTLQ